MLSAKPSRSGCAAPAAAPDPHDVLPGMKSDAARSAKPDSHAKTWQVGTLTYTTGGLVALFCFLLWGDFAWALKDRSVPQIVQLLLKNHGASDLLAGFLIGSLPGAISIFLGPIISFKSDRHRGRWGRRIPFLIIPTPFIVLSMVGLAFSPQLGTWLDAAMGSHSLGLNPSILVFFGLFWTIFEFSTLAANAVFGALINDVVPRAVIGRFFGMFRALSLIAGMLFFFWLMGKAESQYVWIFLGIACVYGGGLTVMCLNVKEGAYPPPPSLAPGEKPLGFYSAAKLYFRECFGNPFYRWVAATIALSWMSFVPINLFNVFFAKEIEMSIDTYGKCVALTYLISLVLSYAIGALADRFHPLRVGLSIQVLIILVTLWAGFYARSVTTFGIAVVAHGVLAGSWMTATASLGQTLLPRARFAQFASAMELVRSLGTAAIGPITGWVLDMSDHAYRLTYLAGGVITVLALSSGLVLHAKFMALGGPRNYSVPE